MFMAARRLFASICVMAGALAILAPVTARADAPVTVKILVIEASRTAGKVDPAVASLAKAMPGYSGARLVDALEAKVAGGSSVSLEIKDRKEILKVTVLKAAAREVHLKLAIDALKFSTKTSHKLRSDKDATVLVRAKKTGKDTALFLAVTPRL